MSKSSTVTVRETPVAPVATATSGALTIHGEVLLIETDQRVELVDLTNRIMEYARRFKIREGLISLWSMHTTCALFINEFQTALLTDIKAFLEKMVDRDEEWLHNNPDHSDCDRMNADAHLRALLLGHSLTLQISGGRSGARAVAADPDGRARWPARPLAPRPGLGHHVVAECAGASFGRQAVVGHVGPSFSSAFLHVTLYRTVFRQPASPTSPTNSPPASD